MMSRRRALMMARGGGSVQGTELEFIGVNGYQAINLGVYPNANTKLVARISGVAGSTGYFVAGNDITTTTAKYLMSSYTQPYLHYGTSYRRGGANPQTVLPFELKIDGGKLYINGSVAVDLSSNTMGQSETPIVAFAGTNNQGVLKNRFGSSSTKKNPNRCWGIQVFDGDEIVRDMIPFMLQNGEVGMLDRCGSVCAKTGTSFYNNTATFSDASPFIAGQQKADFINYALYATDFAPNGGYFDGQNQIGYMRDTYFDTGTTYADAEGYTAVGRNVYESGGSKPTIYVKGVHFGGTEKDRFLIQANQGNRIVIQNISESMTSGDVLVEKLGTNYYAINIAYTARAYNGFMLCAQTVEGETPIIRFGDPIS